MKYLKTSEYSAFDRNHSTTTVGRVYEIERDSKPNYHMIMKNDRGKRILIRTETLAKHFKALK